jgi:hypothetical protein
LKKKYPFEDLQAENLKIYCLLLVHEGKYEKALKGYNESLNHY